MKNEKFKRQDKKFMAQVRDLMQRQRYEFQEQIHDLVRYQRHELQDVLIQYYEPSPESISELFEPDSDLHESIEAEPDVDELFESESELPEPIDFLARKCRMMHGGQT